MKYGIELEFFVSEGVKIVPAYLHTSNLDGNPVVGELRTKVHNNIVDCIFELEKLIYLERKALSKRNMVLDLLPSATLTDEDLKILRKSPLYINRKRLEVLDELSIYPNGETGKILEKGQYKASLQINVSEHTSFDYFTYNSELKSKSETKTKIIPKLFDYVSFIQKLDKAFEDRIKKAGRIPGVYAIKDGEFGQRIEYRSLPNNIHFKDLIDIL